MLEKTLEKKCCKKVQQAGGYAIKISPFGFGVKGFPDRLMLLPGAKVMFIEFKKVGAEPEPLQDKWLRKLRKLGFRAEWCDNSVAFDHWLDEALER